MLIGSVIMSLLVFYGTAITAWKKRPSLTHACLISWLGLSVGFCPVA
jgi:hypothetical protein